MSAGAATEDIENLHSNLETVWDPVHQVELIMKHALLAVPQLQKINDDIDALSRYVKVCPGMFGIHNLLINDRI